MSRMKEELLTGVLDDNAEIALLRSVFQRLPYLKAVHVHEAIGGYVGIDEVRYPPKYLQRHVDSLAIADLVDPYSGDTPDYRSVIAMPIFTALALEGSRLTTFSGTGFDAGRLVTRRGHMDPRVAENMLALIRGLQNLTLTLEESPLTYTRLPSQAFATFISAASNLESLTLDCNGEWDVSDDLEQYGYDMNGLMRSLNEPDITFASLKTLTMSNVLCRQDGLESFLFRHSQNLRILTLQNVTLLQTASVFSCGVRVLENLRDNLQLEHFTMKGSLNNTGVQNLLFDSDESLDYRDHGTLSMATELWVTGKIDEMPQVLQRVAIQDGKKDLELPRLTEAEIIESGLHAVLPNLRSVESEQAQMQQLRIQYGMPSYPNLNTNQGTINQHRVPFYHNLDTNQEDPDDWLTDEMETLLSGTIPQQQPSPWTERFLKTYPEFNGRCSEEEFDRMMEAMEAAELAGSVEEDSDDESYYSASEDI